MSGEESYAQTARQKPYVYKTNMEMIEHWAELYPDKEAFVEYNINGERTAITCARLLTSCQSFGRHVIKAGIRKGDIGVLCMNNSIQLLIAMFGVQYSGGIPIAILSNVADGSDVIETIHETKAKLLVIEAAKGESNWDAFRNILASSTESTLQHIFHTDDGDLRHFNCKSLNSEGDVLGTPDESIDFPKVYPEDIAIYNKSSGSTGKPKLVGHNHFGWMNNNHTINDYLKIDEQSRYFCDRPFGWGVGSPRTFLSSGATRIFVDTRLSFHAGNIGNLAEIISKESCSHVYLPGYMIYDLLHTEGLEKKFSSVRYIKCAGERISKKYADLIGRFCQSLCVWYGSSEATGVTAFVSSSQDDFEDGIVGTPVPGVEMKLVDEKGEVVSKGKSGELYIRSVYRFVEYKGAADLFNDVVDKSNWFHMGDICHIRKDGNFVLDGRTGDQMSVGIMKTFPFDIEKILLTCAFVGAAIVVPVPDERLYNAICACIIPSSDIHVDISDLWKSVDQLWTNDALLKPKYYLKFHKFPLNSSGKIDRRKIRCEAVSRLRLGDKL